MSTTSLARRSFAQCCLCTCYASPTAMMGRRFQSTATSAYASAYNDQEDYHDARTGRRLTARLDKTKKRITKRGQDFVDKIILHVSAGKGGDGGVAFHTEKFVPNGPPSGGNGGQGGNVYIRPVAHLSSLSTLKKRMSATNGQPGQGTWRHGKRGEDLIIEVPYGTVIREQRGYSVIEEEKEQEILSESLQDFRRRLKREAREEDDEELIARRRKLFVLYPSSTDENAVLTNKQVNDLEMSLLEEERRQAYKRLTSPPLEMDFDQKPANVELDMELNNKGNDKAIDTISEKMLLLKGGQGGYGNPYFTSTLLRTPKFATRGRPGESMRLDFELKTLADVGLVGLPNAGKSTLLRALTHSRSTVASYAFTTLSPQIGTLIVFDDASFSTITASGVIEETSATDDSVRTRSVRPAHKEARQEMLRLTIADCPGLLPRASDNVGLGHDFLRHIERSKVLVYVIDLSARDPQKDVQVLRSELEAYKPGLSQRARIIVGNKADVADESSSPERIEELRSKLAGIRQLAKEWQEQDGVERAIIPMSAKQRGNVQVLVDCLVDALPKPEAL